jgi:chaperonin GroES
LPTARFYCKKIRLSLKIPAKTLELFTEEKSMTQQTEKKMTIKPVGYRVLAQRMEQEEVLKGGILLPETAKKKQEKAKIIAIGTGKLTKEGKLIPIEVKVGDTILMDKYSGQEISLDDEEYVILKADDVIAIIEE